MAKGKDRQQWNHTRALAEIVWAAMGDGKPLPARICQPYYTERKLTKRQAADNMADLMGALGRMYGG